MQPSGITRIYRNAVRPFAAMKSENIGGLVSMASSCLFLLGGDSAGIVVALSFLIAEIILARYGHTRAGYSAGGLFFSFGDARPSARLTRGCGWEKSASRAMRSGVYT